MGKSEFAILAKGITAIYGNKVIADQDAFEVWYELLKDLDYKTASAALQRYMMTNEYPPKPADIRREYTALTAEPQLDEMAAWDLVSKAIRDSAYNYEAEFNALPATVQRAVGSSHQLHIWAIDEHYNEGVTRSNFLKAYDNICEQEKSEAAIPEQYRQLIHETAEKLVANDG
ncbi:MAG: hypothetical protein LUD72_02575 [Bacteroidales bacterium]|nr:hypothetical protein [Bacteroidales bacterium]